MRGPAYNRGVRAALALLWLLPVAVAGPDYEAELRKLLPMLASNDPGVRALAARRVIALGEGSIPALQNMASDDPEVRRALRALSRRNKTITLVVNAPSGVLRIGMPVQLEAELINNTDESYLINMVGAARRGFGTQSAFQIQVGDGKPQRLKPDEVEVISPQERILLLEPDTSLRVRINFEGSRSPLRRPGVVKARLVYDSTIASVIPGAKNSVTLLHQSNVTITSASFTLDARGRKPAELDAALRSTDRKVVQSALAEVLLREDGDILALLRKHIGNPLLRARAIARIGAAKTGGGS